MKVTSQRMEVPHPPRAKGWPLAGNLPGLALGGMNYLDAKRETLGDLYRIDAGPVPVVLLHTPEQAQHVLLTNSANYVKQGTFWSSMRSLVGLGLPTAEGELWRRRRRMMNPHFRRAKIDSMASAVAEVIEKQSDTWPSGEIFEVGTAISRVTMAVVVRTMFGTDMSLEQAKVVTESMAFSLDHMLQKVVTDALPNWLPIPGRGTHRGAVQRIDEVLFELIAQRRTQATVHTDLLGMLLAMRDEHSGQSLNDTELRDEMMSLFIAGYETTASAVSWGVARMAADPQLADRLAQEATNALGDRPPTPTDLPQLEYTRRFYLESLRLDAPVFFLPRVAKSEDIIDGSYIAEGTMVSLMIDRIHRHPQHWNNPEEFAPDRFLDKASKARHSCAWLPFGAGQRQCIGQHLATLEGIFLLATLARKYRFELVDGFPSAKRSVTKKPQGGMRMRATRRTN